MAMVEKALRAIQKAIDIDFKGNKADAGREWGTTNDQLIKWLRYSKNPTFKSIAPILEKIGCDLIVPPKYSDESPVPANSAALLPYEERRANHVPVYAKLEKLPDGNGVTGKVIASIEVPTHFIKSDDVIVFVVQNDNMSPTVKQGALAGISTTPLDRINLKRMYLLDVDSFGQIVVRVRAGGKINEVVLHSDNQDVGEIALTYDEYKERYLGRVEWTWQVC